MPQNRIKRSVRSISSCPVKERRTEEREALSIEVFREGNTKNASVTHESELPRNSKKAVPSFEVAGNYSIIINLIASSYG